MGEFGAFFGKVAGKICNAANGDRSLWCYNCKRVTNQVSVGYGDTAEADGESGLNSAFWTLYDYVPVCAPLTAGNPYCCSICNKIRIHGGILSRVINDDRRKRKLM